jgi:hypothetical protein
MTEEYLQPLPPIAPFFRFPDETTGMAALEAAGLLTDYMDQLIDRKFKTTQASSP